jgi:hypothetical protein
MPAVRIEPRTLPVQLLPALLALLVLAGPLRAQRPSAVNRLYQYEAALREELARPAASGGTLPAHQPPLIVPAETLALRDAEGRRQRHAAHSPLTILGTGEIAVKRLFGRRLLPGWRLMDENGARLGLELDAPAAREMAARWQAARLERLADSLTIVRNIKLELRRRAAAERELAAVDELARRYRGQPGAHRLMEPVALLRAEARPDPEDPRWRLPLAWRPQMELSTAPWGPPLPLHQPGPDDPWPVLEYAGAADGAWRIGAETQARRTLGLPETGWLWITAATLPDSAFGGLAGLLGAVAREDGMRARDARRLHLLQRWPAEVADRILERLAWVGMSQEMLLESLGEPARREPAPGGELWTYAEGNRLRLVEGEVREILQP